MGQGLSIGELAGRCGVSVRALRLYEDAGLVRPLRTEAGRRVYGPADVSRLQQVLVLKKAGCTLARIGELLRTGRVDPAALMTVQIAALMQQKAALDHSLAVLRAAQRQLADGDSLTLDALCNLIRSGEQTMTEEAWKPVFDKYYSPEDMAAWDKAKTNFTDADSEAYGQSWRDVISRVEAAMAEGVAPDAPRAMALAKQWYDLQQPLVQQVGIKTWNKAATMYQEMQQWRSGAVQPPFTKEVYDFASKAMEAARAKGLVPPRIG